MEKIINNQKVNIETIGQGSDLLLLHGWGTDISVMEPMQKHFSQRFRVTSVDLPGFGQSPAPKAAWSIYDYADFVEAIINALVLKDPIILGHSFGGRISIILASRGIGSKIILTDSAGIRPKRSTKYYLRVYSYKAAKKVMRLPFLRRYNEKVLDLWRRNNPSSDYAAAQGIMREIFIKVVNEDLAHLLAKISAPTLLIWGENDTATPLSDGKIMEKLIPDSGLVVFPNCGHYCFLDAPVRFYTVVGYFLGQA